MGQGLSTQLAQSGREEAGAEPRAPVTAGGSLGGAGRGAGRSAEVISASGGILQLLGEQQFVDLCTESL